MTSCSTGVWLVLGAPGGGWEMPGVRCHSKRSSPGGVWVCGPGLGRSGQIWALRQGYRRLELLSRLEMMVNQPRSSGKMI